MPNHLLDSDTDVDILRLSASLSSDLTLSDSHDETDTMVQEALKLAAPQVVPRPDLSLLKKSFAPPHAVTDDKLLVWLRSADVLLVVADFHESCLKNTVMFRKMQRFLPAFDVQYTEQEREIAVTAANLDTAAVAITDKHKHREALLLCATIANKIAHGSTVSFFDQLVPATKAAVDRNTVATRALLTAYVDLVRKEKGFFAVLLESKLAQVLKADVRRAWEWKYPFEGEIGSKGMVFELSKPAAAVPALRSWSPGVSVKYKPQDFDSQLSALLGSTTKDPQLGSTTKGTHVESTTKDPQLGSTTKGTQLESTTKDPQLGSTTKGTQVESTTKDPQLGSTTKGTQLESTTKGTQLGSTTKSTQLGNTTKGTQLGNNTGDTQLGSTTGDTQLGSTTQDTKLGSTAGDIHLESTTKDTPLESTTKDPHLESTTGGDGKESKPVPLPTDEEVHKD